MTAVYVNILAPLVVAFVCGVTAWAWRVERHMSRMRNLQQLPAKINKLDRRTMLMLMKLDPVAAQEELKRDGIQTI